MKKTIQLQGFLMNKRTTRIFLSIGIITNVLITNIALGKDFSEYSLIGQYEDDPEMQRHLQKDLENLKKKVAEGVDKGDFSVVNKSDYDTSGKTPLCYAIENDDFEFVEYLLENGALLNDEIKGMHSSRPIFYANSLEMVQYLQDNGADIHMQNEGQGVCGGMNFLHQAIHSNTKDDRLFEYMLSQGLNPQSLNNFGGNLWDSLICGSVPYPKKRILKRAATLHALGINPKHKNHRGKSAIDIIKEEIASETKYLNSESALTDMGEKWFLNRAKKRDELQKLVNLMESSAILQKYLK